MSGHDLRSRPSSFAGVISAARLRNHDADERIRHARQSTSQGSASLKHSERTQEVKKVLLVLLGEPIVLPDDFGGFGCL
jgi:hypothetical protein